MRFARFSGCPTTPSSRNDPTGEIDGTGGTAQGGPIGVIGQTDPKWAIARNVPNVRSDPSARNAARASGVLRLRPWAAPAWRRPPWEVPSVVDPSSLDDDSVRTTTCRRPESDAPPSGLECGVPTDRVYPLPGAQRFFVVDAGRRDRAEPGRRRSSGTRSRRLRCRGGRPPSGGR